MINLNGKNYKLYYLDTCALSEMVKDKAAFGSNLLNLVLQDGIIALSSYSLWELKSSPVVYADVITVITSLPAVLLKDSSTLVNDEYKLLIKEIGMVDPIGSYLLETKSFASSNLINSLITNEKKDIFKNRTEDVFKTLGENPSNIYSRDDLMLKKNIEKSVQLTAYQMAYEYLAPQLQFYSDSQQEFPISDFPSLIASSYILHYKYRQAERKGMIGDIPDILISSYYPYVDVVITEANQCDIIKQIQKRHNFLMTIKAVSMRQVRNENYEN